MDLKPHCETRDGRNWCLIHETWWKLCDCRGEITLTVEPDGTMDATTTARLVEFLDKRLGPPTGEGPTHE